MAKAPKIPREQTAPRGRGLGAEAVSARGKGPGKHAIRPERETADMNLRERGDLANLRQNTTATRRVQSR
jgi:hypothetical protein